MFHLVVMACLNADPSVCDMRMLPAGDSVRQGDCRQGGEQIARDWFARHPEIFAPNPPDCVATDALPALAVENLGRGVFVHLGRPEALSPENAGRIANLSFVIGDSVLVIDAGGSRAEGEALYAAIRRETDLPISHLVLTHMHPDHILGSEVFAEAGATIGANAKLPPAVSLRSASWRQSIPAQIGTKALLGTQIAPVDQLVSAPLTLDLGRTKVTLTPVATAHTDNDLTVFDSRSGALFTGDLVFRELTPVIDGSLSGWEGWLAAPPRDPAPSLIIPGHGPIQSDWQEAIAPQKAYLDALRHTVGALIAKGRALSEAVPATVKDMQAQAAGWADFDATTARNAASAFSELEWQ